MISLSEIKEGKKLSLKKISNGIRAKLIRLGFCEGDQVKCTSKIPGGPVVLKKGLQEIAIGNEFAKDIDVEVLDG